MTPFLRQQLDRLALRLAEVDAALADPAVVRDVARLRALNREHARVGALTDRWQRYCQREQDLAAAREMQADPDFADMAREEIDAATAELAQLEEALQLAVLPRDPDDDRNAFLEIRAGTGGDE